MHASSRLTATLALVFAAALVAAGCSQEQGGPQPGDGTPASGAQAAANAATTRHVPAAKTLGVHIPVGGSTFLTAGDITLEGDTVPGSASFDGAAVWDVRSEQEPAAVGGGSFAVTIGGTLYQAGAAESAAFVIPDDETGTDYLVLGAFAIETDANGVEVGSMVYVIVPAADFAPGATVSLDGADRLALFGWGPLDADTPQVAGAAVSGQVTFVSGSLATGGTITATLAADFAAATWPAPTDPVDPPVGDPVNNVVPGTYALAFSAQADVYCEGSLAGKEAEFALLPAAVGLADGPVAVAILTPEQMALSGDVLTAAFGASTVGLDWLGDPSLPGLFVGWAEAGAAGPLGTIRSATYFALDGATASATTIEAGGGAEFDDRSSGGGGWCDVQWSATLTAAQ